LDPRVSIKQKYLSLGNTVCITCTSTVAVFLNLIFQSVSFSVSEF